MAISAFKKLQSSRNRMIEQRLRDEATVIALLTKIQNNFHCRRKEDPQFSIYYYDHASISCKIQADRYDPRLFWTESERFFDMLGVDPEEIKDTYWNYSRDAQTKINGISIRFELHFVLGCVPIKKLVTYEETVGYTCS